MPPTPQITGPQTAEVKAYLQGDIGGKGVSRFRFLRNDGASFTVADCNAAGAAVRGMYNAISLWPTALSISFEPAVEIFDTNSALVNGFITMTTVPGTVTGSQASAYAAGVGARINWKTSTIVGRRLLRGATYMIPLASGAFSSSGAVSSAITSSLSSAGNAYLAAMAAANLVPVVWHRPSKGFTTGGLAGNITAVQVPSTPSGLRSRRS